MTRRTPDIIGSRSTGPSTPVRPRKVVQVSEFFKALGPEHAAKLKGVTMDMSAAYTDAVTILKKTRWALLKNPWPQRKLRTITRRAYGFHGTSGLISFIILCRTGLTLRAVSKTP